jgi:hypothetical protein
LKRRQEKLDKVMTDDPADLDERRGTAAPKVTENSRKRPHEFQAEHAALQLRRDELGKLLFAAPAET